MRSDGLKKSGEDLMRVQSQGVSRHSFSLPEKNGTS